MPVGNKRGMYTESRPWLMPNENESKGISIRVIAPKDVFSLKSRKERMKHAQKHNIIALRTPSAFATQPEKNPPASPPTPNNIMLRPRSPWPSASPSKLCTHVGTQLKIAHRPMSIEPKITEPLIKSFLCSDMRTGV